MTNLEDARKRYGELVDTKGSEEADARLVYLMSKTNIALMRKHMPHWTVHFRNRGGKWYLTVKGTKSYNEAQAMITYHFPSAHMTSGGQHDSTWRINPNTKDLDAWDYRKWE